MAELDFGSALPLFISEAWEMEKTMKELRPSYYKEFRCIGGACTDTCCAGWEIDVDDVTYDKYQKLPLPLREYICSQIGEEGESHFFRLREGRRCPFLNQDNLCDIFIQAGEDYLCDICREHPRFYNWIGSYTEVGLGLCCEEAQRLILQSSQPAVFEETGEDIESEDILLELLLEARKALFAIVQNRELPIFARMGQAAEFVEKLQDILDFAPEEELAEEVYGLCAAYLPEGTEEKSAESTGVTEKDVPGKLLRSPCITEKTDEKAEEAEEAEAADERRPADATELTGDEDAVLSLRQLLNAYTALEALDPTWTDHMEYLKDHTEELLLHKSAFLQAYSEHLYEYEHLMVYFLYRYFLESVYTMDVQTPVWFAAASLWVILLCDIDHWRKNGSLTFPEQCNIIRRYSKEIEYCTENVEAICSVCGTIDWNRLLV